MVETSHCGVSFLWGKRSFLSRKNHFINLAVSLLTALFLVPAVIEKRGLVGGECLPHGRGAGRRSKEVWRWLFSTKPLATSLR